MLKKMRIIPPGGSIPPSIRQRGQRATAREFPARFIFKKIYGPDKKVRTLERKALEDVIDENNKIKILLEVHIPNYHKKDLRLKYNKTENSLYVKCKEYSKKWQLESELAKQLSGRIKFCSYCNGILDIEMIKK